jgi:salicylate hydroxylase
MLNMGKRLKTYESVEGGGVLLSFVDGTTAEADVLIGADGIKSM